MRPTGTSPTRSRWRSGAKGILISPSENRVGPLSPDEQDRAPRIGDVSVGRIEGDLRSLVEEILSRRQARVDHPAPPPSLRPWRDPDRPYAGVRIGDAAQGG